MFKRFMLVPLWFLDLVNTLIRKDKNSPFYERPTLGGWERQGNTGAYVFGGVFWVILLFPAMCITKRIK